MDDYDRIRELGRGSFGAAILVRRKTDQKQLVVKEVNLGSLSQKEIAEARKEANFLANLSHPNIVRYEGCLEKEKKLMIFMEFCEGGDLSEKIKKQNGVLFTEEIILDWFCQTCLAVRYCHERKILHRDIKTSNIFLHRHGKQLKLGDFGIARTLDGSADMARTCIGTPYYLSPEICEGKPYNARSDVWSLGCVLYEMITLRHAFEAANMRSLVMKIIRGQYPPINPRFSYELKKLVAECFKREPTKRPSVNAILRKPFVNNCALKFEPTLNVKSAPSSRQVSAAQKRSKSPEPSKRVVKSSVVDQKARREQIGNVYGNQKVIIPRKSKSQQSREERAKKARDQERAKMLAGIQRSVANSHASKVSVSAIEKKPSPAAEIWENRNKEILREYYQNKEAAVRNKAAVRGDPMAMGPEQYRQRIEEIMNDKEKDRPTAPVIMKPTASGGNPSVMGSPAGSTYERTKAKTKESVLKQLNERRASWAIDPKKNVGPGGDGHEDVPEERPNSARKLWESPSKTVVHNFEEMKVSEGSSLVPPSSLHPQDDQVEPDDDPKPVFGNTVLIRASHQVPTDEPDILSIQNDQSEDANIDQDHQKEVSELKAYFSNFLAEGNKPNSRPSSRPHSRPNSKPSSRGQSPISKRDRSHDRSPTKPVSIPVNEPAKTEQVILSLNQISSNEQEQIINPSTITSSSVTDSKREAGKSSILKRLAAKFSPKTTKRNVETPKQDQEFIPIKRDEEDPLVTPNDSPQNAIFNDETIRSSKPQRESPVLIRNDPIDILVKKYEPSRYSPQSSPFQFQSPKRQSASSKKLQTPPPSPLPNFPQTPKRPVSSSQSMRLPSPEVSVTSPRLAESPKRDSKPLNVKFNQLRGSQSLPDLSQEEKSETQNPSKTSHTPANQNVSIISSAQSPEKSSNRTRSENKTSPESNHSMRSTDQSESSPFTDRQNEDISDEIVFTPHEHESTIEDQPTNDTLVATGNDSTNQGMVFIKVPEGNIVRSSGEEVMANLQSLLDVEESINIDDIENDVETIRTEIESESETEDELWDSPNSTTNLSMTETVHDFDKLEMKREKIEIELGIHLAVQAYKILATTLDSSSISSTIESRLRDLLGDQYDQYYPRLMQLVVQDSVTYDQSSIGT